MRTIAITCLMIAGFLAGCADETAGPTQAPEEEAFNDLDTTATTKTGVIRGIVIDPAIVPVEGVTINVMNTEMQTTTNADGAFAFSNVEPGTYFIKASKLGFTTVQQSTNVEAGVDKPPIVKIQMVQDANSAPYVQPYTFNGFIACSWTLPVVALAMCSVPELVGIDLGDEFITYMDTNGVPTFVQGEQVWDSTQTLGEALSFSIYDGDTTAPGGGSTRGVSPLILKHDYEYWNSTSPQRMVNYEERIAYRAFAAGYPGTEAGGTWGVGVVLDQPFDIYTHMFYNYTPPEDWLFIEDGSPPQP